MKLRACYVINRLIHRIFAKVDTTKLGHIKKISCVTFGERIKKNFIFYFIEFDIFGTTINCCSVKSDPFCPLS